MKGNSNTQPERLQKLGNYWQVRWNIVRNDRTDEDGNTYESWDYEYANCENPYREGIIEGIIRSEYSASQVEAIIANYLEGEKTTEFVNFLKLRKLAKAIADNISIDESSIEINDRVGDVEATTAAIIEALNEKNILP